MLLCIGEALSQLIADDPKLHKPSTLIADDPKLHKPSTCNYHLLGAMGLHADH